MSISIIEGFKVYDGLKEKSIIINSDCIDECMDIYKRYNLDGVAITTSHDYKLGNVNFLAKYPDIRHLSISADINNIDALYSLSKLESLIISGKNREIDFSNFPFLVELTADWSAKFYNMDKCIRLKRLSLYGYNPKTKDCSDLSDISWLKRLKISHSSILSLKGLEVFGELEEVIFNYSKLETLCCLEKSKETLVSLLFDHCKSIKNYSYITLLKKLEILAYNDCGILPSINFIREMPSLKDFRFVGTDVADGDMTPCLSLKNAAFTNKKHFTHTMVQIKKESNA